MTERHGAGANRSASRLGMIAFAAGLLAAGVMIVALWLGWMRASTHAPAWIVASAAAVVLAGGTIALLETLGVRPDPRKVFAALFLAALALPFNWMAFGPGNQRFSTILDGIEQTEDVAETGVRLAFSPGALVIDGVLAFRFLRMARRRTKGRSPLDAGTVPVEWAPSRVPAVRH